MDSNASKNVPNHLKMVEWDVKSNTNFTPSHPPAIPLRETKNVDF